MDSTEGRHNAPDCRPLFENSVFVIPVAIDCRKPADVMMFLVFCTAFDSVGTEASDAMLLRLTLGIIPVFIGWTFDDGSTMCSVPMVETVGTGTVVTANVTGMLLSPVMFTTVAGTIDIVVTTGVLISEASA